MKWFETLWFATIGLFILDFFGMLMNNDILGHLESNPLFKHNYGLLLFVVLNIFFLWAIKTLFYRETTLPGHRFAIIQSLVLVGFFRIISFWNALQWNSSGVTPENIPVEQVAQAVVETQIIISVLYLVPFALSLVSYFIFSKEHKIVRRGQKND